VGIFAMEYIIKLTPEELTHELIDDIKRLLDKDKSFEITLIVKEKPLNQYWLQEPAEEYRTKLNRAIDDAENNRNLISFTAEQFEAYAAALSKK